MPVAEMGVMQEKPAEGWNVRHSVWHIKSGVSSSSRLVHKSRVKVSSPGVRYNCVTWGIVSVSLVFKARKQNEISRSESSQSREPSAFSIVGQEEKEKLVKWAVSCSQCKTPFLLGGDPSPLVAMRIPESRDLAEHLAGWLGSGPEQ